MIHRVLKYIRFRMMARQLRKPGFWGGMKTGKLMNKANEHLYDQVIDIIEPKAGDSILEIGFGNGAFFSKFFSVSTDLQITGIDFSPLMVKCATKENRDLIQMGKLVLLKGESSRIQFPDNSFDTVFCINVIYFWQNPEQNLKEILRVLKPSGVFYAIFRTEDSMQLMPFTKYGFRSYREKDWKQIMDEAGFTFTKPTLIKEPDVIFKNSILRIESWCFTGTKADYK